MRAKVRHWRKWMKNDIISFLVYGEKWHNFFQKHLHSRFIWCIPYSSFIWQIPYFHTVQRTQVKRKNNKGTECIALEYHVCNFFLLVRNRRKLEMKRFKIQNEQKERKKIVKMKEKEMASDRNPSSKCEDLERIGMKTWHEAFYHFNIIVNTYLHDIRCKWRGKQKMCNKHKRKEHKASSTQSWAGLGSAQFGYIETSIKKTSAFNSSNRNYLWNK